MPATFAQMLASDRTQALPLDAPITMGVDRRSPRLYVDVIGQFDVEHSARYQPCAGNTYCNVFATDTAKACCLDLPHWVTPTGRPAKPGKSNLELGVNDLVEWLGAHTADGWRTVLRASEAQRIACLGVPVFATWYNARGHGHIAVVRPDEGEIMIAQAGATCHNRCTLAQGFGTHVNEIVYWFNR